MVETDWRQILSFSQKELNEGDKEELCESLSWMEADDIELNFSDLKTLFRLAQDILKYKSEQVNSLLGQLETSQRRNGKKKSKAPIEDSPARSSESAFETISHQEEIIKANKDILEQLYTDIAELEGRKSRLEKDQSMDRSSESSRDVMSELNEIEKLERDVTMKNRHIRKLLKDVKVLEEENVQLKEKTSTLKDKLNEATQIIENLTEQLLTINSESSQLKDALGKAEQAKVKMQIEIQDLRQGLKDIESSKLNVQDEIQSKIQHWKNIARTKKSENDVLSEENQRLKERLELSKVGKTASMQNKDQQQDIQHKELQEKLMEATNKIIESVELIEFLKLENIKLKDTIKDLETRDNVSSVSNLRNESDDVKEKIYISKLKKKVRNLTVALNGAEEMITEREKELTETTAQLQLLQSGEEGLRDLLDSLKSKKRQLKLKDEEIKTLVKEVNSLHQAVDDLQLENCLMRQRLNLTPESKVETKGILKKYQAMEQGVNEMVKDLRRMENRLVTAEVEIRNKNEKILNLTKHLSDIGYESERINQICESEYDNHMPTDGGGDAQRSLLKPNSQIDDAKTKEMKAIIEENDGLRKGLQEILDFLKDNSTSSSGVLALQCPSLEAVLQSLEARHSAGWFAPHMATILELRAALGGKDALLTALHEARKETFDVMMQLTKESQKTQELENKLHEIEVKNKPQDTENNVNDPDNLEFGTWVLQPNLNDVDFNNTNQIEVIIGERNLKYENQLKNSLAYFHSRFKLLFDKMTAIAIQSADDQNKWSIQEEQYKAEIENLKSQLTQKEEDDKSDDSPGLIGYPSINVLQRKCAYLEESYKNIRTLIENVKNEYLESKKEAMIVNADYEIKIQRMILDMSNINDKLRNSISVDLFWKQHEAFNDISKKYRKLADGIVKEKTYVPKLYKKLEGDKMDLIGTFQVQFCQKFNPNENYLKQVLSNVEHSVLQKQIERLCLELEDYRKRLDDAENRNFNLQENQSKIIDISLTTSTKKEVEDIKERLDKMTEENNILKEQCQHVTSQLDIALLQLQDAQQRQMSCDLEVNMLRHQILDLQSVGDNKAIVARLSGEILVAHLQASESHKKIERLNSVLTNEIQRRLEIEEMLKARENIFNIYSYRYESKFKYMYEVLQILRQQYHGCLPLISVEKYLNDMIDLARKSQTVDEKLNEIEDLRSNLMIKQVALDDIIDRSKAKCIDEEDCCPHKIKLLVLQSANNREIEHYNSKIKTLEKSWIDIVSHCNSLEKTLILVNQGFEKPQLNETSDKKIIIPNLELEDIHSDEDEQSSRKSETLTLPKPQLLKTPLTGIDMTKQRKEDIANNLPGSPSQMPSNEPKNTINAFAQTAEGDYVKKNKIIQTETDREIKDNVSRIKILEKDIVKKEKEMYEVMKEAKERNAKISNLNKEMDLLENTVLKLQENISQKDTQIEKLEIKVKEAQHELGNCKKDLHTEKTKIREEVDKENKSLVEALKNIETDKNRIVEEYKSMLQNERDEYLKSAHQLNGQIRELKMQIERKETDSSNTDAVKEVISKYSTKTFELEDKCFKLQSELDSCRTDISTYQSEAERWKELATERLYKMEQLRSQLEERHCQEVDSYKAENQHWLSQLSDTQKEHIDLRNKITEQKTLHVKQLAEKDAQIEQLRSVIQNLKAQIMNMQAMLSVNDPSFDLSAMVEVDDSDTASQRRDQLEIRFESTTDLHEDIGIPSSSSTIWQEPVVERLRREKQLSTKQNNVLRRQIKVLAARERRARLEAQNLKNQIYRISTSGSKAVTAETMSLQAKIAALQTQLASARQDTQSSIALWDKMKRAQQSSERWQARFEEKCREVKKIETSLNFAKSAIARLEKEKRVLLNRATELKHDKHSEKQDHELSEKARSLSPEPELPSSRLPPHITTHSLLDRIEAQQRRIAALELAEKGNEPLVSEYEKSLAEITSLKGQVLRLESTLLESQIRSPLKTAPDPQPQLEYWKSYCDMLKEENMQLSLKLSSMEATSNSGHHNKVNDLEKTVLTLRGLVSKLQAEQKSSVVAKRQDSKLSSGLNLTDKKLESYRIEISNLKRSIVDKDNLLEKSKEMLRIAAEREDELLNENAFLRRQLNDMLKPKPGFVSV